MQIIHIEILSKFFVEKYNKAGLFILNKVKVSLIRQIKVIQKD